MAGPGEARVAGDAHRAPGISRCHRRTHLWHSRGQRVTAGPRGVAMSGDGVAVTGDTAQLGDAEGPLWVAQSGGWFFWGVVPCRALQHAPTGGQGAVEGPILPPFHGQTGVPRAVPPVWG